MVVLSSKKPGMLNEDNVSFFVVDPVFELGLDAVEFFVATFSAADDRLAIDVMASRIYLRTSNVVDGWVYGNDHCLISKQRG